MKWPKQFAYVHRPGKVCGVCGGRDFVWLDYQYGYLCWACLELYAAETEDDAPEGESDHDRFGRVLDLYCWMNLSKDQKGN